MTCDRCKWMKIVRSNRGRLYAVCICEESKRFLTQVTAWIERGCEDGCKDEELKSRKKQDIPKNNNSEVSEEYLERLLSWCPHLDAMEETDWLLAARWLIEHFGKPEEFTRHDEQR